MNRILVLLVAALLGLTACGSDDGASDTPAEEPEPTALPDVARIVCDEQNETRIETPSVKPQPDGIHLEIVNNVDTNRALSVSNAEGGGMGLDAAPGTSTLVVDVEPGALTVACNDPATEAGGGQPLEVVDEDAVWVSTTLGCTDQVSVVADYMVGAKGETTDPLEAARKGLQGYAIEPDDVFERAGYPDTDVAKVRVVRDGEVIAVVDLNDDGTGKWLFSMATSCTFLEG